jgi:hypothetical protein
LILQNSGVEYVTVTRAVSIGPLEKNLRPDSKFALSRCGAFRDTTAHRIYVAFWDMPNARTGETSCIQYRHFGAVIAQLNLELVLVSMYSLQKPGSVARLFLLRIDLQGA